MMAVSERYFIILILDILSLFLMSLRKYAKKKWIPIYPPENYE